MKKVHDDYVKIQLCQSYTDEPFKSLLNFPRSINLGTTTARLLYSPLQMANEGVEMGHCIAGYHVEASAGEAVYYSIEDNAGTRSSLEVKVGKDKELRIGQHYGKYNNLVEDEFHDYAEAVVNRISSVVVQSSTPAPQTARKRKAVSLS